MVPVFASQCHVHPFFSGSNQQHVLHEDGFNMSSTNSAQSSVSNALAGNDAQNCHEGTATHDVQTKQAPEKENVEADRRKSRRVVKTSQETIRHWCGLKDEDSVVSDVPEIAPPERSLDPVASSAAKETLPTPIGGTPNDIAGSNVSVVDFAGITPSTAKQPQAKGSVPKDAGDSSAGSRSTKILKLNGSGGLGSPSKETQVPASSSSTASPNESKTPQRRGRPPKRFIVRISYDLNNDPTRRKDMAQKIDSILESVKRPKVESPRKPLMTAIQHPQKPTHPFFTAKSQKAAQESAPHVDEKSVRSFTTPVKLRRSAFAEDNTFTTPQPTNALSSAWMQRRPAMIGLLDPMWPSGEFFHVKPDISNTERRSYNPDLQALFRARRQKHRIQRIGENESILSKGYAAMKTQSRTQRDARVRLPIRLPTSSGTLRSEARKAVVSFDPHALTHEDEWQHPALQKVYTQIGNSLSPFDSGKGESKAWVEKYAPRKASDVLTSPVETTLLKRWLSKLKVDSVETRERPVKSHEGGLRKKKRRRKAASELDNFIVSGSEEECELQEVPEAPSSSNEGIKSLIRESVSGDSRTSKTLNAVLLSGPHGCGKTAAAYGVAHELGFDVFEINPSNRRSGRDIIDKIGDMTINHQVGRASNVELENEPTIEPDEKQSSLSSFFKSKSGKSNLAESSQTKSLQTVSSKPSKSQRQALILIEEADILFEEDKQFWETIHELTHHSRRPIIITCNDERLIPMDDLNLHALLRFTCPPVQLATSYLVLITAAENHLLDPGAVRELYQSNQCDLRASIASLNVWCQIGVGDQKGGLEWSLNRWPPASDVDAQGQQIHVVSKDTFDPRSAFLVPHARPDKQDTIIDANDVAIQAWQEWNMDPSMISSSSLQRSSSMKTYDKLQNIRHLRMHVELLDLQSATDTICKVDLPGISSSGLLDPTIPPMPESQRAQYMEGYTILDAPLKVDHSHLDALIQSTIHLSIAQQCDEFISGAVNDSISALAEQKYLSEICQPAIGRSKKAAVVSPLQVATLMSPVLDSAQAMLQRHELIIDTAPYVRLIAAHDRAVEDIRNVIDGPLSKRRRTRVSRSAAEGSARADTRRESWFGGGIDFGPILSTGGEDWIELNELLCHEPQPDDGISLDGAEAPSAKDGFKI